MFLNLPSIFQSIGNAGDKQEGSDPGRHRLGFRGGGVQLLRRKEEAALVFGIWSSFMEVVEMMRQGKSSSMKTP